MSRPASHTEVIEAFSRQRLLVIGDVMLDWFIWGNVSRISPEAPVPVVEVQRESRFPGGAANVARNITPFGATIGLAGLHGDDANGDLLLKTLAEHEIGTGLLIRAQGFPTITKTRVVARHQQVVRIDREKFIGLTPGQERDLVEGIAGMTADLDGIIIEDYGKGLLSQGLVDEIVSAAGGANLTITADPKPGNSINWSGVTCIKPNRQELFEAAGIPDRHRNDPPHPLEDEHLLEAGRLVLANWNVEMLLVTLGELGMLLFGGGEEENPFHIPTRAKEVFDVSGAGDTAIAVFTMALCAGAAPRMAAEIANIASGIVVGKLGTTPIEREELLAAFSKS